jgi:hypothetical protein
MKHEWRKAEKTIYLPKEHPELIRIPSYPFLCIKGVGNPNQADFQHRVEILFSLAYGIKMAPRKGILIDGYFEYTVYPLEGIWDYSDYAKQNEVWDKEHLVYTLMIRQPSFVSDKLLNQVITLKGFDDPDTLYNEVQLVQLEDGLCVQMMHTGSFDNEPKSFTKMQEYIDQQGLIRTDLRHREIYLSDFRTTEADKLKTVLRVWVKKTSE